MFYTHYLKVDKVIFYRARNGRDIVSLFCLFCLFVRLFFCWLVCRFVDLLVCCFIYFILFIIIFWMFGSFYGSLNRENNSNIRVAICYFVTLKIV